MLYPSNRAVDETSLLAEQAWLLISRLERLSADSVWAHRSSGLRGAMLRLLEHLEQPQPAGAEPASGLNQDRERLRSLTETGYDMLERAAKELL
jgi:hypothetical protein